MTHVAQHFKTFSANHAENLILLLFVCRTVHWRTTLTNLILLSNGIKRRISICFLSECFLMLMAQWKVLKVIAYSFCRLSLFGDERNAGMCCRCRWSFELTNFQLNFGFVGASGWAVREEWNLHFANRREVIKLRRFPFHPLSVVSSFCESRTN